MRVEAMHEAENSQSRPITITSLCADVKLCGAPEVNDRFRRRSILQPSILNYSTYLCVTSVSWCENRSAVRSEWRDRTDSRSSSSCESLAAQNPSYQHGQSPVIEHNE